MARFLLLWHDDKEEEKKGKRMKSFLEKERPWRNDHEAIEMRQTYFRKKWVMPYTFVLAFFCIGLGIMTKYRLSLVLGVLVLLAVTTKRYAAVTGQGFEQFANMYIFSNHRLTPWEAIDTITYEKVEEHPEVCLLYFTRGDVTMRALFPTTERKRILRLAEKYHPGIKIHDGAVFKEEVRKKYGKKRTEKKK